MNIVEVFLLGSRCCGGYWSRRNTVSHVDGYGLLHAHSTPCLYDKTACVTFEDGMYSRTALIWALVVRIFNFLNHLASSGKSVDNSAKLTCLEITGYRIKYRTMLWLIELRIRRGRKI